MAKKQDFSKINTGDIYSDTIAEATQEPHGKYKDRKTYNAQEAAEYSNKLNTSGRKGLKLPRVNLALAPDMYDYVKTMSKVTGMTYTEFVDKLLRDHKAEHGDIYAQAVKIRESI
jgi:hypothetical protein